MAPQTDAATAGSSSSDFFFKSLSNDATNNTNTPSDQTANASPDASNNNRQQQPASILAGLNAFDVDDAADGESSASANFADQLALWTNANFSFDGPTGHALLLDEDKDEGDGQNQSSGSGGNNPSNAAAAASGNDGDASTAQNGAAEPTHRDHKQQADQHQQSQYFAPPSSAAGEGRRPGWNTSHRDELARRNAENSTPNGTSGNGGDGSLPFSVGQNAFSAFASADDGRQQQQQVSAQPDQQQQHQQAAFIAPGGFPGMPAFSPELFQALAFQQLLSGAQQNGFGAQGLMGMSGFNPAFAASAGGFGGLAMPSQFMPPHIDVHAQHHQQQNQQPWQSSSSSSRREASDTPSDDELEDDSTKGKASSSSSKASGKKRRVSSSASNKSERSKAAAAAAAAEEAEIGRAAREEIPPLNLVDTGNPEADAEANRLAIEEDKRRRNTAASARFRIKKKAREQALEQTTKELESRVKDLEEQNNRLSTENGWLKSLITIRPGGGPAAPGTIPFMPNAMAGMMPPHFKDAAQQMMMFNNAGGATSPGGSGNGNTSGSANGSTVQPSRDTGLRPRGVGTEAGSSSSSSRSSQSKGKRGRED